jgi:hypothetical protein
MNNGIDIRLGFSDVSRSFYCQNSVISPRMMAEVYLIQSLNNRNSEVATYWNRSTLNFHQTWDLNSTFYAQRKQARMVIKKAEMQACE